MRLILDTNVLVSANIQFSYPHHIVQRILVDRAFELCISKELLAEYYEVLSRKKFARFADFYNRAKLQLEDIEKFALRFDPQSKVSLIADDADNRLLELAEASKAAFIITGNTNDFTMELFGETKIVSPKDFFELLLQMVHQ